MILRFIIPFIIFREFFYFRMVDVGCLFIFFLFLDSIEGIIVYHTKIWNRLFKAMAHINNLLLLFAISSIFVLINFAAPIKDLLSVGESYKNIMDIWIKTTVIIFFIVILFGYTSRKAWGVIQNLIARLAFLIYCSLYVPWWAITLFSIGGLSLIAVEGVKYNWNLKKMRKKDPRFT